MNITLNIYVCFFMLSYTSYLVGRILVTSYNRIIGTRLLPYRIIWVILCDCMRVSLRTELQINHMNNHIVVTSYTWSSGACLLPYRITRVTFNGYMMLITCVNYVVSPHICYLVKSPYVLPRKVMYLPRKASICIVVHCWVPKLLICYLVDEVIYLVGEKNVV